MKLLNTNTEHATVVAIGQNRSDTQKSITLRNLLTDQEGFPLNCEIPSVNGDKQLNSNYFKMNNGAISMSDMQMKYNIGDVTAESSVR